MGTNIKEYMRVSFCGDGTGLYPDGGVGTQILHEIKLYRNAHAHTHIQRKACTH